MHTKNDCGDGDEVINKKKRKMNLLRARIEPSPAKTNMKVEMNSAKAALMESGWVASSALPNAYRRSGMVGDLSRPSDNTELGN